MYLHLGNHISVPTDDIIGIFDLDNASYARDTRDFLRAAEEEGMVLGFGQLPAQIPGGVLPPGQLAAGVPVPPGQRHPAGAAGGPALWLTVFADR